MSWEMWLVETGGKIAAGVIATFAFKWLDDRLSLRARVAYKWSMLRGIRQHPKGHVPCPVCYGSGSHNGPLCSFCHVPNQPSELRGYMTYALFAEQWDSLHWKPRPEWAGFHMTRPLPEVVVQGWTPRDQRAYREGLEAPYKTWRTPYKAG